MAGLGRNVEPILQFRTFVSAMPSYLSKTDVQLNRELPGNPVLARPGVHPNERHIAVGTENPAGADQILVCINTESIKNDMEASYITAQVSIPKAVQGTHWLGDKTLLVCVGDKEGPSQMLVFKINVDADQKFESKDNSITTTHTVREIAVNSIERNKIVFGGYDQCVSILDFNHGPMATKVFPAEGDISSVRWAPYHSNRLVSCTTNEGQVKIYDILGGGSAPAWQYQTDIRTHVNLYSHCQVSEYQMLLGYEDNYIEAIDIRKSQTSLGTFMTGTTDPYCYMVGDLHYREASGLILATGMADFSVYKHFRSGPDKNVCKLWCHAFGEKNRRRNDTDAVRHAVFLNDSWVVSTQEGSLGLYKIE